MGLGIGESSTGRLASPRLLPAEPALRTRGLFVCKSCSNGRLSPTDIDQRLDGDNRAVTV